MAEHLISIEEARENLLSCAAFLAEDIKSSDGHAEAMKTIVPYYLGKNDVDLAAEFADTVDDPFVRDKLLTLVAEKCAATGDDEYAFQLVEAIEDTSSQGTARERIALQKSARGEFEKALKIAQTLDHADDAFADIAAHQAASGDEASALQTIEKIDFPNAKVNALLSIASLNLQKGETLKAFAFLERAFDATNKIEFNEEKIRAFLDIARMFAQAKRNDKTIETLDKARASAETIEGIHRDSFFTEIALEFLRAGTIDLADRTLDLVTDKTQMASCLTGFSQEFFAKGEREEALEALEEAYAILKSQRDAETRDSRARFRLFGTIAVQFANFEKVERAIEIAQNIIDENEQTSALAQIAQICALQGKDEFARQAVQVIADDAQKMFALIGMSDAKNRAGKREEALEILREAAALAETVPQLALRSSAFNELAKRFREYNETEKAREILHENLETIAQIRDESSRAVTLAGLAGIYEQANFALTDSEREILLTMIRRAEW